VSPMADSPKRIESSHGPGVLPSRDALKDILRIAVDAGRLIWSKTWDTRCNVRGGGPGFNTVDAVNVIRQGRIMRIPSFDLGRRAWRIEIADLVEGYTFVVDLALNCEEDFFDSPYVEVVTAFFRRGSSREVDEWRIGT
jgi:hypothetical protein